MNDIFSDRDMQDRLAENLFQKYYKYKGLEYVGDKAIDSVFGNEDRDLERRRKKLEIMSRQKDLGMPMDGQDYEDATNDNKSFFANAMSATGGRILQKIPGPDLLKPATSKYKPVFKIAESVIDELPSIQTAKRATNGYKQFGRVASLLGFF